MKYLGKLLLELAVMVVVGGIILFVVIVFLGDKLIESLRGLLQ